MHTGFEHLECMLKHILNIFQRATKLQVFYLGYSPSSAHFLKVCEIIGGK